MIRKAYLLLFIIFLISCEVKPHAKAGNAVNDLTAPYAASQKDTGFYHQLSGAAIALTFQKVVYNPAYFVIPYPNGDIPKGFGVCSDVVIRAYRKLGIDLQKEVHEDMASHFDQYPHKWGLRTTDKNIDHRRVPNLMKYFERKKAALAITANGKDYAPGDVVCWELGKGITHIGIVIDRKSSEGSRNLIVHNIGGGQVIADCLFKYAIIGHYRFRKQYRQ